MIRKLLKVEFRDALSSMLPIGVGMVALSALVALTSMLTGRLGFHSGHWDWLNALLSFATGVCFIAVLVVCFAANVNRFFRMLGEEGYVQLVLPATAAARRITSAWRRARSSKNLRVSPARLIWRANSAIAIRFWKRTGWSSSSARAAKPPTVWRRCACAGSAACARWRWSTSSARRTRARRTA